MAAIERKPTLDYASRERIWSQVDVRFWVTFGVLLGLLVLDLACVVLNAEW